MKKIFLALSVFLSTVILSSELSWVDKQVDAIQPPRSGMKASDLKRIKKPFIFLEKNRTTVSKENPKVQLQASTKQNSLVIKKQKIKTVSKVLVLSLLMNNSAMIGREWYKLGDKVNGFEIIEINRNSILLRKQKKKLLLSTNSNTKKLKFLNK